jgi:hypothetical protein
MKPIKSWLLPLLLFSLTLFVRAYHLPQTFLFAEDQEDIGLRVKQLVVDRQPTLLSAKFSQPGLFLGPGYLYLLIPFMLAFDFHPTAMMAAVVTLAALTATVLYFAATVTVNSKTGLLAWTLYTFSPLIHQYDRIFWNPNLILLSSSLALLSLVKLSHRRPYWFPILALAAGLSLQSHPQGIILTLILLVYTLVKRRNWHLKPHHILLATGIFFSAISPLIAFELRHGFVISRALLTSTTAPPIRPYYVLFILPPIILLIASLARHLFSSRLGRNLALAGILLFIAINSRPLFSQPDRPDSVVNKLAAVQHARQLVTDHAVNQIQFQTSAEGYQYLFWYLNRRQPLSFPLNFYQSWHQVEGRKIVIHTPADPDISWPQFGNIQVGLSP